MAETKDNNPDKVLEASKVIAKLEKLESASYLTHENGWSINVMSVIETKGTIPKCSVRIGHVTGNIEILIENFEGVVKSYLGKIYFIMWCYFRFFEVKKRTPQVEADIASDVNTMLFLNSSGMLVDLKDNQDMFNDIYNTLCHNEIGNQPRIKWIADYLSCKVETVKN